MNKAAYEYLKNLEQTITNLIEDQEGKLGDVGCAVFTDDVSENVITKLDDILYEIETIMSDVEEGYYSETEFDDDNNDEDFDEY